MSSVVSISQIQECNLDFNAKVQSMQKTSSESIAKKAGSSSSSSNSIFFGGSSFSSSFSNQKTDKSSNEEKREFSIRITVKAIQDDMPTGMRRILDVLEQSIIAGQRTGKSS